jgi:hypothetical protein
MSYDHMQNYPRIIGRIGEDAPIELWRSPNSRPITQADINHVTNDLSPVWVWWIEYTTPESQLIGSRPHIKGHNQTDGEVKRSSLELSREEKAFLEENKITPSIYES